MKVLFLDFDGVLNSDDFLLQEKHKNKGFEFDSPDAIDAKAVEVLNKIIEIEQGNLQVVISSTWRLEHKKPNLRLMLEAKGFRGFILGVTPHLPGKPRGLEIQRWLDWWDSNPEGEDITGIVILDDNSDMEHLSSWLVKTNFKTGLKESHITLINEILNKPI